MSGWGDVHHVSEIVLLDGMKGILDLDTYLFFRS
jgi:hypothetical protein